MKIEADYEYRTGIGEDLHRLVRGRDLILGGVLIPFAGGLLGHSDGDVAIHAVIDAILGAMGMGDIGTLFPDTDDEFKDADSKDLLGIVGQYLQDKRWEVVNVDLTIHAEAPKLAPYKAQMKRGIASVLGIDLNDVNVKAKTHEELGEIGKGEAMAATAITLLRRRLKRTL